MKDLNLYPFPNPLLSPPPAQMLLLSHNTPFLPLSVQAQRRGPEKMTHVLGNGKVHLPTNQPRWVLCSPLSQWQPTQWGLDGRLNCTPGTWQHVRRALWPTWVLYPVAQAVFPWNILGASDHLSSDSPWPQLPPGGEHQDKARNEQSQAQALTRPSWRAVFIITNHDGEDSQKKNLGLKWENHLFSSFSALTTSPSFHPDFLNLYLTAATRKGLTGGLWKGPGIPFYGAEAADYRCFAGKSHRSSTFTPSVTTGHLRLEWYLSRGCSSVMGNSLNPMLLLEVGRKINRRAAQEAPSPKAGELPTW